MEQSYGIWPSAEADIEGVDIGIEQVILLDKSGYTVHNMLAILAHWLSKWGFFDAKIQKKCRKFRFLQKKYYICRDFYA